MSDRPTTVKVTIDGQELEVPPGTLVIRAAEQLGTIVPRFCDHRLLAPLGACRQCLVEVAGQRKPLTACTTTVTDGMEVKTQVTSEVARAGQEGNLELLLINHPLDCPMCDKGGECPLQDQTLAHGPGETRFVETKRHYEKPIKISETVLLDRERCVLCARCTRFSSEIAGDPFIELFERGALEQVAIYEDEPYESHYSGNVVQICPVGALTSPSYRFQARPFDLTSTDGVCNHCAAGCNLRIDARRGMVTRQLARDNDEVNEAWNCDRGRYGFAYAQSPERVLIPHLSEDGKLRTAPWSEALRRAADGIRAARAKGVGVLVGGHLTDQDAYALQKLARVALGTNNVDARTWPEDEPAARPPPPWSPGAVPRTGCPPTATWRRQGPWWWSTSTRTRSRPSCGCGCARPPSAGACRWWPSGRGRAGWPSSPPWSPPCPAGRPRPSSASAAARATPAGCSPARARVRSSCSPGGGAGPPAGWPRRPSWPRPSAGGSPGCPAGRRPRGPGRRCPAGPPARGAAGRGRRRPGRAGRGLGGRAARGPGAGRPGHGRGRGRRRARRADPGRGRPRPRPRPPRAGRPRPLSGPL